METEQSFHLTKPTAHMMEKKVIILQRCCSYVSLFIFYVLDIVYILRLTS